MSTTLSLVIGEDLEFRIRDFLAKACADNICLATAESCTGGILASLMTDIEGMSHVFDRAFVVYTDEAKIAMLGVSSRTLSEEGAVSARTATEMAKGALDNSDADIALAITGYAGPAGENDEEGLVYIACSRRGGDCVVQEHHFGPLGRSGVRLKCIEASLSLLSEMVSAKGRMKN